MKKQTAVVTGSAGFIGTHLVTFLKDRGYWVRGVDIKEPEFGVNDTDEFLVLDLRDAAQARRAVRGVREVYALAADMGGIGYITANHADIAWNNTMINAHTLAAAEDTQAERYFYASSACVYPHHLQQAVDVAPLKEDDAIPADPEPGYGWEKLYAEQLCEYFHRDYDMTTRVARFHNIYGPLGTYDGGREKSPAAICRKIALAVDGEAIEVWGDGKQTRSYMHVSDCVEGIYRLMQSNYAYPINLGRDDMVSINQLVDIVADIAGKKIYKSYDETKPQGVRGRNSDNSRARAVLGWEPSTELREGLAHTYHWISAQIRSASGS